jgi:hypothetical protein
MTTAPFTGISMISCGHQLKDVMSRKYLGQMTDEELKAVWMYLQSLPSLPQDQ